MNSSALELETGVSIGDVAKICGVQPHTIRFWEKEFAALLAPQRTQGRQRRYRNDDINRLLEIKQLLWVHRFTIEGAKKLLRGEFVNPLALPDDLQARSLQIGGCGELRTTRRVGEALIAA